MDINILNKINIKKIISSLWPVGLVVVLIVPILVVLYSNGLSKTDDGGWMIIRFSAFYQELSAGQFPVRFLDRLNFGYGYPVANFLYPGFMYLAVPIKIVGLTFTDTIRVVMGLSFIFGGVFTFYWFRKIFDTESSVVGALFYTYAPYHLFDAFKRGSVGELLALSFAPFLFWQIEKRNIFWIAVAAALLIVSHNTLAILFLAFSFLYMGLDIYVSKKKKLLIKTFGASMVLGFGLSAFFWIPAVFELSLTVFASIHISDFTMYFADIWLIGIPTLLIILSSIAAFVIGKAKVKSHRLTIMILGVCLISLFLSSNLSDVLWRFFPVGFIQFPFRILSVVILCGGFLTAFVLSLFSGKIKIAVAVVCSIVIVTSAVPYFVLNVPVNDDGLYATNEATTTVQDEYMPKWVREKPSKHFNEKVKVVKGQGKISQLNVANNQVNFNYSSASPSVVQFSIIYYPGWKAYSNNTPKAIFYDNQYGLIQLKLNSGEQKIILKFGETPLRLIADAVSIFSAAILLLITFKYKNEIS